MYIDTRCLMAVNTTEYGPNGDPSLTTTDLMPATVPDVKTLRLT